MNGQNISQIEEQLERANTDTLKVDALLELSRLNSGNDPFKAYQYAYRADSISQKSKFSKGHIKAVLAMAIARENAGAYTNAVELNEQAFILAEANQLEELKAKSLLNLSNVYFASGDLVSSKTYIKQAIVIYEKIQDKKGRAFSYMALGNIAGESKQYEEAINWYQKSLAIKQQLNDEIGIAKTLSNIGLILKLQSKYDEALEYSFKSLEIKKRLSNANSVSNTLSTVSEIYLLKEDVVNGLEYAQSAYDYAQRGGNLYYKKTALNQLIQVYTKMKANRELLVALEAYKLNVDSLMAWEKTQEAEKKQRTIQFSALQKESAKLATANSTSADATKHLKGGLMALAGVSALLLILLIWKWKR